MPPDAPQGGAGAQAEQQEQEPHSVHGGGVHSVYTSGSASVLYVQEVLVHFIKQLRKKIASLLGLTVQIMVLIY